MKKAVAVLLVSIMSNVMLKAQNIGIGTTTPNNKAILDISSINKGVLFPTMTTSQRLAITTPPNGLLVFDNDKNELHQYAGGSWTPILNGNYWIRPITSRSRITNASDSVGIGTNSPSEWLDVNGNIRSRNNVIADNNITATGNIGAGSISTGGNITAAGTGFFGGSITSNDQLIINNSAAILQLRNGSNVNTGFLQLSGNDVRLGTNGGNSTGNLIIRMNSNNRVTINPNGDIDLDGKITRTAVTGSAPLLPVAFGQVDGTVGSIISGTGNFTVTKTAPGIYLISSPLFTSSSVIVASPNQQPSTFGAGYNTPGNMVVFTSSTNCNFQFVVYNVF